MIPKEESGHPIQHQFQRQMPTSNCIVCHVHPGTNMVTSYYGMTWWDNEADGAKMYPKTQHNPTEQELHDVRVRNPEGAAPRGLWSRPDFSGPAPAVNCANGVRPNSPPHTTSVSFNMPRAFKSFNRPATGLSEALQF